MNAVRWAYVGIHVRIPSIDCVSPLFNDMPGIFMEGEEKEQNDAAAHSAARRAASKAKAILQKVENGSQKRQA